MIEVSVLIPSWFDFLSSLLFGYFITYVTNKLYINWPEIKLILCFLFFVIVFLGVLVLLQNVIELLSCVDKSLNINTTLTQSDARL